MTKPVLSVTFDLTQADLDYIIDIAVHDFFAEHPQDVLKALGITKEGLAWRLNRDQGFLDCVEDMLRNGFNEILDRAYECNYTEKVELLSVLNSQVERVATAG